MSTTTPAVSRLMTFPQQDKTVWERLPVAVKEAVGEFKQRLQKRYGDRLGRLVLYGSYARGDFHEESDVDLLIVLTNEPEPRLQSINELVYLKYDLLIQYGVLLSAKVVSMHTLVSSKSAVYHFIRKEGVSI